MFINMIKVYSNRIVWQYILHSTCPFYEDNILLIGHELVYAQIFEFFSIF